MDNALQKGIVCSQIIDAQPEVLKKVLHAAACKVLLNMLGDRCDSCRPSKIRE